MAVTTKEVTTSTDGRALYFRSPPLTSPAGRRKGRQCPDHGGALKEVNLDTFTFEKDGLDWVLDYGQEEAQLQFCPECIQDRYRDYDRADASIEELVEYAVRKEWGGPIKQPKVTPASVGEFGELAFCPFCGAESTRSKSTEITCPEGHGPMRLEVERR